MTTSNQTQTVKLSAAQVIAVANSMSNEQKILLRSIERLSNATLKLTNRYAKKVAIAMSLVDLALVDLSSEANPIKKSVFAMNDLGWAVWHYIVNGTLPQDEQPAMETSTPLTNVKLSAAQVAMIQRIGLETISLIGQTGDDYDTLITLITLKMIRRAPRFPKGREMYELSVKGLKFFETLATQPAMEPAAPVIAETTEDLPAKMPLAPLMDEDTNPIIETSAAKEYAVGDTVSFHYFLSNSTDTLYTGRIAGLKSSVRWGETALIVDIKGANRFHVPPRYVSLDRIKGVIEAPAAVQEDAFTEADVQRLEKAWFTAQDAPCDFDEAISDEFFDASRAAKIAYLVAYATYYNQPWMMPSQEALEMLKAFKNASQSTHSAHTGVSGDVQVTSIPIEPAPAEMASTRDLEASEDTRMVISPLTGKPLPAPTKTTFMTLAPKPMQMTSEQQASHDGLQRLLNNAQ